MTPDDERLLVRPPSRAGAFSRTPARRRPTRTRISAAEEERPTTSAGPDCAKTSAASSSQVARRQPLDVWCVFVVRIDDFRRVEVVLPQETAARVEAQERSGDAGIAEAFVTRFRVGERGTWTHVARFVRGTEQSTPWPLS